MMLRYSLLLVLLAANASPALAQTDRVRTNSGSVAGQVTGSTPLEITITRGSTEKKVKVSEIMTVEFGGEPGELRQARINARNGGYKKALDALSGIDAESIDNPFIQQEIDFYTVYCRAKLALLGEGAVLDAGKALSQFDARNKKSFHRLEATELLGDLLVAAGQFDAAAKRYQVLQKVPFPAYKIRGGVLLGEVSQAQGDHATAIRRFDAALAISDDSPGVAAQKLRAKLGRAISLAATGKLDEGVALVQSVIKESDPELKQLNATAYNALGDCYRQAGRPKDALFAYLHVDLLYAAAAEQHAEALYYLASLFDEVGKTQQAREARQTLRERYAGSEWAKK